MWNKYHALFFERTYVEDLKYYSKAVLAGFSEVEKILDIPFVWVLYFTISIQFSHLGRHYYYI